MTRSAEYWKRRAEANMDAVQRGAEQRLARLGRAYHQAARELEGEVQRILGTYAKRFDLTPEEAAAALREPADEESRAYGYRVSRAEALEKAIRERLNGLGAQLERETAAQREWTASKSYQSARKMMQDMTGGVVSHAAPDLQGLLRAMDTAWSGRNYSARVWRNTDQLAQLLEGEIEAAFLSGKSVRRMANVIMDRFGVGYRAAECLMRTETSYVQNQTAAQSYRDAGCTDYEILTASDRRTCRRCAAQNGRRYLFTEMQVGENAPPFHPNCRCTILPVVGEDKRLAKKAEKPEKLGFAVAKTGESGIIPEKKVIMDAISSETVTTKINIAKQERHIKNNPSYIEGRSYLYGSLEDAQRLIEHLAGTGEPVMDKKGNWLHKERVRADKPIGVAIDSIDGKETETRCGMIIYSRTGTHLVPRKEESK